MDKQKLKSLVKTILFLAVLGALAYYFNRPAHLEQPDTNREEQLRDTRPSRSATKSENPSADKGVGFTSKQKLAQHYQKHGKEFGDVSVEHYLGIAQSLRDRQPGGEILEHIRPDGITSRFDRSTGTFVAFNKDKTIRTCFKPNDGERYFQRQKNKDH